MKIKKISLALCMTLLVSLLNIPVSAAEKEIYSEDFNASSMTSPVAYGSNNPNVVSFSNSLGYGSWSMDASYRSGFQFSDGNRDVTTGKLHIKFDFQTNGASNWQGITIGGFTGTRRGVTLLSVNKAHASNGNIANSLAVGGRKIAASTKGVLIKNNNSETVVADTSTWYTYDGILDLDNKSIEMTLINRQTGEEVGYCNTGEMAYNSGEWEAWPEATWPTAAYPLDCFAVTSTGNDTINVDNVCVGLVEETNYITVDSVTMHLADGTEETNLKSINPDITTVKIMFSEMVSEQDFDEDNVSIKYFDSKTNEYAYVNYDGEFDSSGCGYVLTFDGLSYGTDYELIIDSEFLAESKIVEFTTVDEPERLPVGVIMEDNFETTDSTVYDFSNGAGSAVNDTGKFEIVQEDENFIGVFHRTNTAGHRLGFKLDKKLSDGLINIHFDFRAKEGKTTFVVLGNEYADKSQHNWLSLLTAKEDANGTRYLYGCTGHGGALLDSAKIMKTPSGANATIENDVWYSYDALLDVDNRSIEAIVTDSDKNVVGSITLKNMLPHDSADNNKRFNDWPSTTDLRALATMYSMDMDNIRIEKVRRTVEVDDIIYIDADGALLPTVNEFTKTIKLVFNTEILSPEDKILLDGEAVEGNLLSDNKTYVFEIKTPFKPNGNHTISVLSGIESKNEDDNSSVEKDFSFRVIDSKTVFYEDYEGENIALHKCFAGSASNCLYNVIEDGDNRYIQITGNNARAGYEFTPVTDGRVKIHFKFMFDSVSRYDDVENGIYSTTYIRFGHEYGATDRYLNDPLSILMRNGYELRFGTSTNADTNRRLGNISAKKWYTYDAVIDIENRSISITVDTDEGTKTVSAVLPLRENTDTTSATGSGNMYQDWPNINNFDQLSIFRSVNLDDILIQRVYEAPAVKTNAISFTKADGTEQHDFSAVDPAVTHLNINFGEKMKESTLTADNIIITDTKTGKNVEYSGSIDESGRIYSLGFSGLSGNTDYVLSVSGNVENVNGDKLAEDFSVTFTTTAPYLTATLDGVTAGGNVIDSLSELNGSVKVSATIFNACNIPTTASVYVLYYDANNKLLNKQISSVDVPVHSTKVFTPEFHISKPEGTASVSILIWEAGRMPLAKQIKLQ